jgi:tRNA nucleotidyltransferase (CCA-adding enzyme)
MRQFGLLKYVIPQLELGDKMAQPEKYHKYDVLEHSFRTVLHSDPSVRLAALLHDVGKPYCFKKFGNMHGHEKASEYMSQVILTNLKAPNEEIDEVSRLCLYHMYDFTGNTGIGKMRQFIAKNYDIIDKLIYLIEADRKGSGMPELSSGPSRLKVLRDEMAGDGTPIKQTDLKIGGGDLLSLGIRGEPIGVILRDVHEKCIMEPRLNNREWLMEYARRRAPKQG